MSKVLIVEDDAVISNAIEKVLKKKGLEVAATDSGIGVMDLIKEHSPEVVLLDINLPGMSGLNILEEIKKQNPSLKVVMITAVIDHETEQKALNLGANAFLKKPFMVEVLERLFIDLGVIST